MKYFLSHGGMQLGPWTIEEVKLKLKSNEINWMDYLFDEAKKEWILLMEHPLFAGSFKDWIEPQTVLLGDQTELIDMPIKNEKEWFVLKGDNKYGPFSFFELLKMLQEKSLYEYDFVWHSQMPQWSRVADLAEFKPDRIKTLHSSGNHDIKDAFYRRRYCRATYNASLLVHNSKSVYKGNGLEISAGGAGITVEGADFEMGQTLFLHFKAGDGVPPFNAICTVVSKFTTNATKGAVKYGVKFTSISHSVQRAIRVYADNRKSA
jgi:hypothetical protein